MVMEQPVKPYCLQLPSPDKAGPLKPRRIGMIATWRRVRHKTCGTHSSLSTFKPTKHVTSLRKRIACEKPRTPSKGPCVLRTCCKCLQDSGQPAVCLVCCSLSITGTNALRDSSRLKRACDGNTSLKSQNTVCLSSCREEQQRTPENIVQATCGRHKTQSQVSARRQSV